MPENLNTYEDSAGKHSTRGGRRFRQDVRSSAFRSRHQEQEPRISRANENDLGSFKPDGHVYIVGTPESNIYKIGKAIDVDQRLTQLNLQLPWSVELVHAFPCEDYGLSERALHHKYQDGRMKGEFFRLAQWEVAFLKSIVRMRDDSAIEVRVRGHE